MTAHDIRVDFVVIASNHGSGSSTLINSVWPDVLRLGGRCAVMINEPFDAAKGVLFSRSAGGGLFFANGSTTNLISNLETMKYIDRSLENMQRLNLLLQTIKESPCQLTIDRNNKRGEYPSWLNASYHQERLRSVVYLAEQRAHGLVDTFTFFSELRRAVCEMVRTPDCVLVHKFFPAYLDKEPNSSLSAAARALPYLVHPRTFTIQLERIDETARQYSNFRRFVQPNCERNHGKSSTLCKFGSHAQRDPWASAVEAARNARTDKRSAYIAAETYFQKGYENLAAFRNQLFAELQ